MHIFDIDLFKIDLFIFKSVGYLWHSPFKH